jgi:hypothetical protein
LIDFWQPSEKVFLPQQPLISFQKQNFEIKDSRKLVFIPQNGINKKN